MAATSGLRGAVEDPSLGLNDAEEAELASVRAAIDERDAEDFGDLSDVAGSHAVSDTLQSGPVEGGFLRRKLGKAGPVKLKTQRKDPSLVAVWAKKASKVAAPLSVAAGFVVLVLAVPQRDAMVRMLPDLAPLYEMAGLHVNVRGVEISDFTAQREVIAGVSLLRIDGALTNTQAQDVPLGPLRLALMSATGEELFVWRLQPDMVGLLPGQSLPVSTELTAPPETVASVAVRFLLDDERLPGEAL